MVQLLPPLKIQKKKKKSASKVNNHKVKIYPQTAPEIPTGESSIGWEAGGATVPPHHPPRGSWTVSANCPGRLRARVQAHWRVPALLWSLPVTASFFRGSS